MYKFRKSIFLGSILAGASYLTSYSNKQYLDDICNFVLKKEFKKIGDYSISYESVEADGIFQNNPITFRNLQLHDMNLNNNSEIKKPILKIERLTGRTSIQGIFFGLKNFLKDLEINNLEFNTPNLFLTENEHKNKNMRQKHLNFCCLTQNILSILNGLSRIVIKDSSLTLNLYQNDDKNNNLTKIDIEYFDSGKYGINFKRLLTHAKFKGTIDNNPLVMASFDKLTSASMLEQSKNQTILPNTKHSSQLKPVKAISEALKQSFHSELGDTLLPSERYVVGRIQTNTLQNLLWAYSIIFKHPISSMNHFIKNSDIGVLDLDFRYRRKKLKNYKFDVSLDQHNYGNLNLISPLYGQKMTKDEGIDKTISTKKDIDAGIQQKMVVFIQRFLVSRPKQDVKMAISSDTKKFSIISNRNAEISAIFKLIEDIFSENY